MNKINDAIENNLDDTKENNLDYTTKLIENIFNISKNNNNNTLSNSKTSHDDTTSSDTSVKVKPNNISSKNDTSNSISSEFEVSCVKVKSNNIFSKNDTSNSDEINSIQDIDTFKKVKQNSSLDTDYMVECLKNSEKIKKSNSNFDSDIESTSGETICENTFSQSLESSSIHHDNKLKKGKTNISIDTNTTNIVNVVIAFNKIDISIS